MCEKCSLTPLTLFVYMLTHAAQNGAPTQGITRGEMSYNALFSVDCSRCKSDFTYPVSASAICGCNGTQGKLPYSADTMFVAVEWADNEWRREADPGPAALTYILPFLKQKYSPSVPAFIPLCLNVIGNPLTVLCSYWMMTLVYVIIKKCYPQTKQIVDLVRKLWIQQQNVLIFYRFQGIFCQYIRGAEEKLVFCFIFLFTSLISLLPLLIVLPSSLLLSLRIIEADMVFCVIFMHSELVEKQLYKINPLWLLLSLLGSGFLSAWL